MSRKKFIFRFSTPEMPPGALGPAFPLGALNNDAANNGDGQSQPGDGTGTGADDGDRI